MEAINTKRTFQKVRKNQTKIKKELFKRFTKTKKIKKELYKKFTKTKQKCRPFFIFVF